MPASALGSTIGLASKLLANRHTAEDARAYTLSSQSLANPLV